MFQIYNIGIYILYHMNNELKYLVIIYGITGLFVFSTVLIREFYDENFSNEYRFNKKIFKNLNCDLWCISHFIMYVLLGYLSPKYWMVSFILSILWEYSEEYMEKHDIKIISNFRNDIYTNTTGLIIGLMLNKYIKN